MRSANIALSPSPSLQLPFPVQVGAFCLLWASAFSVAKIAVTDCPPLLVLTARFFLAAVFVFAAAPALGLPLKLTAPRYADFRPARDRQSGGLSGTELSWHPQHLVGPGGAHY